MTTHTLTTPLTELLGIDMPIVQAPIGSATCPELAAGVANAGGLGMLAITWRTPEETRAVIQETRKYTDAPIGVNIVVDENAKTVATTDHLAVCSEEKVDIVSFSFGDCAQYVDCVHGFDGHVLQTVGSADEAKRAVDAGVDSVVAQGWEAGGHIQSDVASMPLIPRVVDAVDVPVIAAGGIADGRGIAAALTLGADGAWLGTRFLATKEAHIHEQYREQVLTTDETGTYFGQLFDEGWPDVPHRVLWNSTVEQWNADGRPPRGKRPKEGEPVATNADTTPVERYADSLATPDMEGDIEALPLYAGQSTGLVGTAPSATTVVETLIDETHTALTRAETLRKDTAKDP